MRKFKIDKNISRRIAALSAAGVIFVTGLTGCKSKENKTETVNNSIVTMVEDTTNKIDAIIPEASDELVNNASIMLLLDIIAKEDENGKISADVICEFKSKLDVDNMISEFTSFLDMIGFNTKESGKVEKVSTVLPEELKNDKIILSNIETILENIIKYSKEGNKDGVVTEFNKIYTLFVEEKEIEIDGTTFEIRDLTFPSRAVATTYAETAGFYSTNYVTEDKLAKLDERTNDQNNKAYIKSKLEILANQMEEKSRVDIIGLFDDKYAEITKLVNGKVNLSESTIKNLVNYMNLKYISGDEVATKDMNELVGEYEDQKVIDVITAIEAINTYNFNNQKNIIPFSSFLVGEHLNTDTGKTDKIALDFVQYNTIMLNNTDDVETYDELSNNPYFKNVFKYFTKQDFTHIQKDENGKQVNNDIVWQHISDGVNFVNYQVILSSLNKLPQVSNIDNYKAITEENFGESIQYIQNTIMDECKKVDTKEYILTK
ncbi:MAG: hypothetical protein IJE04_03380 [Bacilli bacterium]|nr:hypothetical protein [Bacilli bacterium]